jgi:hypothetical protein
MKNKKKETNQDILVVKGIFQNLIFIGFSPYLLHHPT